MDTRDDVREFLASRRAKITPEPDGLPHYGGTRRVAGLRRTRWAAHDVRLHHTGLKHFAHPVVGRLDLAF